MCPAKPRVPTASRGREGEGEEEGEGEGEGREGRWGEVREKCALRSRECQPRAGVGKGKGKRKGKNGS